MDIGLTGTPSNLSSADLDGNGTLDFLVATPVGGATVLRTLLGDGAGGFTTGPFQTLNVLVDELPLAHLNGDGTTDLGVHTNLHLLNRGDGTFYDVQVLTDPPGEYVATSQPADFDRDGNMDILGAASGSPFIRYGAGAVDQVAAPILGDGHGGQPVRHGRLDGAGCRSRPPDHGVRGEAVHRRRGPADHRHRLDPDPQDHHRATGPPTASVSPRCRTGHRHLVDLVERGHAAGALGTVRVVGAAG